MNEPLNDPSAANKFVFIKGRRAAAPTDTTADQQLITQIYVIFMFYFQI